MNPQPSLGPEAAGLPQLQELLVRFINISAPIAFIVIFFMVVIAGIKYLTSGGDSKSISDASKTLTWALLGALFLILAWLFLKLVGAFTGYDLTHFCLSVSGC